MPVKVRRRRKGEGGKLYKIVKVETGMVEAQSDVLEDARASARIMNAAYANKKKGK